MKVHEFIIQKVSEVGMDQSKFAIKCGVSQPFVNNVVNSGHTNISQHIKERIAKAYNLPLDYFLNDTDQQNHLPPLTILMPRSQPPRSVYMDDDDLNDAAKAQIYKRLYEQERQEKEAERKEKEALRYQLEQRIEAEHRLTESQRQAIIAKEAAEKEETGELPAAEQKRQQQVAEPGENQITKSSDFTTKKYKQS